MTANDGVVEWALADAKPDKKKNNSYLKGSFRGPSDQSADHRWEGRARKIQTGSSGVRSLILATKRAQSGEKSAGAVQPKDVGGRFLLERGTPVCIANGLRISRALWIRRVRH